MNNLRALIKSLFYEPCPFIEFSKFQELENGFKSFHKEKSLLNIKWLDELNNYSDNEIDNLQRKYYEDWSFLPNKINSTYNSKYNTLVHFSQQVLTEENNEPFVVYHNLLKWKDLTACLGEDFFTNSFFAYNDLKSNKSRYFFSWKPFLFSNNKRLQSVLSQGVAENHSHLYASSLNYDISWISLMNNYDKLKYKLDKFISKDRRHKKIQSQFNLKDFNYVDLIENAVTLRLLIFYSIEYFDTNLEESIIDFLGKKINIDLSEFYFKKDREFEFKEISKTIKSEINYLRNFESLKLNSNDCFDYLIPKNVTNKNFKHYIYLYGERKLLYDSFKIIYNEKYQESEQLIFFEKLFFVYLLIKNDFRKELVQLNGRYGFGNFKGYQDDKLEFIYDKSISGIYLKAYLDISFNLNPKLMNVISNEYRIAPCKSVNEYIKQISSYNNLHFSKGYINKKTKITRKDKKNETFYVVHFLKRNDKLSTTNNILSFSDEIRCRHYSLRNQLKKESYSLVKLRESHPEIANKIRAIDAASSEFATRPEVYGQAFRFLKNHHLKEDLHHFKDYDSNKLRITFHAGEDFLDISDGLRYIDECIKYLGMSDGDRIGHGLALGIDVNYYYELKNNLLLIPKQILFDNIVWIINKAKKFGLMDSHSSEIRKLESLYNALASEIYINPILKKYSNDSNLNQNLCIYKSINYNHQLFYDSWKLRGDNPEYYELIFSDSKNNNIENLCFWDRCAINTLNHKYEILRKRMDVSFLYYEYHFNFELRKIGEEIKQFKITNSYINLVKDVQQCMLNEIAKRNICIECNPTSNYLIGTVDKYIQHPIFKFNSKGLNVNIESPYLSASVNTDDSGIFNTSLENEYALLAIALEKEKDSTGNNIHKPSEIYEWIDMIRKIGLQQSFKS